MLISTRWLARHVDLGGLTPQRIVEALTLSTAEVEGLERFAPHLSDVVVGHVVERERHPDADKLSLCKVDIGTGETLQIVCGAPNVRQGLKVAVATIGTTLPGDFKIKKSKIRGVESCGMICSQRELELGEEHDGIWELPGEATIGKPVAEALGLEDWVIEIDNKSLTHRPDLWGHRGIARELAAIFERPLVPLAADLPATGKGAPFPVRIASPACSRYLALAIDGVRAGAKAPQWMRQLLLAVGQRPIEVTVDVSNFVMLDLGQPNHLFDRERLAGGIEVRQARERETMTTLDGVARELTPADLLICSGGAPVALAGVMGGEESKVADGTTRLLLEVATFQPAVVRRTSARLGLRSDSSARFEKHLDPTLPLTAAGHLVNLLSGVFPELTLPAPLTDVGDWQDPARTIAFRPARARKLLGVDLADGQIGRLLERLDFGVQPAAAGTFAVAVPSRRATKDVTIEQDLVEEVGRLYRYGNVPERNLVAEIAPPPRDRRREFVRAIQDRLAGAPRFHELVSYSFLADGWIEKLGLAGEPHVALVNPIVADERRVRRSVVPSLLGHVAMNRRHRTDVRLFEIGKGYRPENANANDEPREVHELALVHARAPRAGGGFQDDLALQLRGVVEDLLRALAVAPPTFARASAPPGWAHPGRAWAGTFGGASAPAIVCAPLEPGLVRALELTGELASEVAVALVDLDGLLAAPAAPPAYRPLPRFPGVKVDVALSVPDAVEAAAVVQTIERAGRGLVAACELFDVYQGPNLEAGRKSLAFHVLLQSADKTLSDQEGAKFLERLERAAAEALGGALRRD